MKTLFDLETLLEARAALQAKLEDGAKCPCCDQFAKIYKRAINASMARDLIGMYRLHQQDWCHLPTVRQQIRSRSNREESKLRYWSLIEESAELREDGGRAGWWRITQLGVDWIHELVTVPRYARIYNGGLLELVGKPTTIKQALGKRFRLDELLAA